MPPQVSFACLAPAVRMIAFVAVISGLFLDGRQMMGTVPLWCPNYQGTPWIITYPPRFERHGLYILTPYGYLQFVPDGILKKNGKHDAKLLQIKTGLINRKDTRYGIRPHILCYICYIWCSADVSEHFSCVDISMVSTPHSLYPHNGQMRRRMIVISVGWVSRRLSVTGQFDFLHFGHFIL